MASLAVLARPRIFAVAALFCLTVVAGPERRTGAEHVVPRPGATAHAAPAEIPQAPLEWLADVVSPPAFADARPWNQGGMVMGMPATHDRIARNALTDLLSGLFHALGSLRV